MAEAALRAAGFCRPGRHGSPPHYVPESDPFLRTLAQCYEAYTGQKRQCLAIGGTYVHDIPGGVAFGPNMPGFVSNLHGPTKDPGGGPAHHRQDLCPSYGGTVPVSQAPF